jgi:YD repeat-containing protein
MLAGAARGSERMRSEANRIDKLSDRMRMASIISMLLASVLSGNAAAQGYALTDGQSTPNSDAKTLQSMLVLGPLLNPFGATATYGLDRYAAESQFASFASPSFIPNFGEGGANNASKGTGCGGRSPAKGDPIVLATGTLVETELDFSAAGEMGLYLERFYSSRFKLRGLLGNGWTTNFDKRLRFKYDTGIVCEPFPGHGGCPHSGSSLNIWAVRPDARVIPFIYWNGGFQEVKQGSVARLDHDPGTGRDVLYTEDNTIEVYQHGLIQSEKNAHGIGWTYHYGGPSGTHLQRVVHTSGREVVFTWSGNQLISIKDPATNVYTYGYDTPSGNIRLKAVTLPGAPTTTVSYTYDTVDPLRLKQRHVNSLLYAEFSYDSAGRAASSQRPNGVERHAFTYTADANGNISEAVEVNPLGRTTAYTFESGRLASVSGHESENCPAASRDRLYDENGNEDLVTDFEGNVVKTVYNDKGQLQQEIRAYGTPIARETNIVWDSAENRPTAVTLSGQFKSEFVFHADNRIKTHKVTNLSGVGAAGQSRTTAYSYIKFPNGMLQTAIVDGPLPNDTATYTYSQVGDLLSFKNGMGHETTYSNHNALGQPGRVTGPNGAITEYAYDERGRVVSESKIINGVNHITTYAYDGFGRLASVTTPDSVKRGYQYDVAGRLISEFVSEGGGLYAQKLYTYNNMSLRTSEEVRRVSFEPAQGTVQ